MSSVVVECPICFHSYSEVDPTTLPCGHSCCLRDAQELKQCFCCNKPYDATTLSVSYNLRDIAVLMKGIKDLPSSSSQSKQPTANVADKNPRQAKPSVANKTFFDALDDEESENDGEEGEEVEVVAKDASSASKSNKKKKRNKKKKNSKPKTEPVDEAVSEVVEDVKVVKPEAIKDSVDHSHNGETHSDRDPHGDMQDRMRTMFNKNKFSSAGDINLVAQAPVSAEFKAKQESKASLDKCVVCTKEGNFQCSKCKSVRYCSRECQAGHWKVHKKFCAPSLSEDSSSNTSAPDASGRKKLLISDLEVGAVHKGYYVEGRIVSDPFRMSSVIMDLKDEASNQMTVCVYDYGGKSPDGLVLSAPKKVPKDVDSMVYDNTFGLRKFQRVRVFDPWCKVAMDGRICIRVEDLNNVKIVGK